MYRWSSYVVYNSVDILRLNLKRQLICFENKFILFSFCFHSKGSRLYNTRNSGIVKRRLPGNDIILITDNVAICEVCNQSFTSHGAANRHKKEVHLLQRHICPEPGCGKSFRRLYVMNIHMKRTHQHH